MNFTFADASLENFCVHSVGNKIADENIFISNEGITIDDNIKKILNQYFLSSFKSEELYRFYHAIELPLNEVYGCVRKVFENPEALYEQSVHLATHLYDQSIHPKIKGGEFYVAYFKECVLNGEPLDAIGIFKSENKDTFLEVERGTDGFDIESRQGININKLDKGCLIFNTEETNGYVMTIVDTTNRGNEARYWKDDFLSVLILNNDFHQTNQFLGIAKQFVTKQLSEDFEVTKTDQIDFLNRSVEYFKENETFEKGRFEEEVFQDRGIIDSFRNFDEGFRRDHEVELADNFEISRQAVKKQARVFKSVLKLDKNFHIYIHGDKSLIEQGVDHDGRKYYKIYYREEN